MNSDDLKGDIYARSAKAQREMTILVKNAYDRNKAVKKGMLMHELQVQFGVPKSRLEKHWNYLVEKEYPWLDIVKDDEKPEQEVDIDAVTA